MKVYIDQNINQKKIKEIKKSFNFEIVQNDTEQQFGSTSKINKAFILDSSQLDGPDVIVDNNIEIVQRVIGENKHEDIGHIYSAHINNCDYFITENVKDFILHGKRELLEQALPSLKIRRLGEFVREKMLLRKILVK